MSSVFRLLQESKMLNDEKIAGLEQAKAIKTLGNDFFAQKNYKDAIRQYHQALMKIRSVYPPLFDKSAEKSRSGSMPKETAEFYQEAKKLEMLCNLNLAACLIAQTDRKSDDYMRAAQYCDKVLSEEPANQKAVYRKGIALFLAKNYHSALDVLRIVDKKMNGKDEKIREYLLTCEQKMKDNEYQLKERLSKAFGSFPSSAAACESPSSSFNSGVSE